MPRVRAVAFANPTRIPAGYPLFRNRIWDDENTREQRLNSLTERFAREQCRFRILPISVFPVCINRLRPQFSGRYLRVRACAALFQSCAVQFLSGATRVVPLESVMVPFTFFGELSVVGSTS